ncbi:MAG: hypothetical protein J7J19_06400 [Thaumarchaeota archaeon]|nr:hypothetical protein [Nitrososphaerota archaeon]
MSLEVEIRELLRRDDELSKLKIDILRALVVFNGISWMSELIPDIVKIHNYSIDYLPTDDMVDEALRQLEAAGFISIEPRMRGGFLAREVYVDRLIRLKDLRAVKDALAHDKVYKDYLSRQMETLWKI